MFYVAKNKPVKREKSETQERGDKRRCNIRDLERGDGDRIG